MPKRCTVWIVVALLLATTATDSRADVNPKDLASVQRLQDTLADLADEVRPSVVAIHSSRRLPTLARNNTSRGKASRKITERMIPSVGSGVIIQPNGYILTNEHVIHGAEPEHIECVLSDGSTYTVIGINSDPRSDLAILKIDATNLRAASLGHLNKVRQGHFAVVMGNPFGSAYESNGRPALSFGVVSAIGRELTGQLDPTGHRYYGNLLQTDARINPGNSGGPLLNIKGDVIGINTAVSTRSGTSEGVGYAIPIDDRIADIISKLVQGRQVEYGFLGVHLDEPAETDRKTAGAPNSGGAMIVHEVDKDSPAGKADIKTGAIITEYDGKTVLDVDHLIRIVGHSHVGKPAKIVYYHDGKRIESTVIPGRRTVHGVVMTYRWRGMRLSQPTDEVRDTFKLSNPVKGVVVAYVQKDSSAATAGFKPGQIIRRIAEINVNGINDVTAHENDFKKSPVEIRLANDKVLTLD